MRPTKHFTFINGYHAESQKQEQKSTQHDIVGSRGEKQRASSHERDAYAAEQSGYSEVWLKVASYSGHYAPG